MSFLDLVLLFAVGSVLGVVIETVFVYAVRGRLESRRGMVYGPFNQVYGFGVVLMTVLLGWLGKESGFVLFVCSAVLGGLFEATCSFCQEKIYGTVSWDFSRQNFSILGGRSNIIYMLYWGLLGFVYVRNLYPWLSALFGEIPLSIKTPVVVSLTIFFVYNLWLSHVAVRRWNRRRNGAAASGKLDSWLDNHFYKERMQKIYPSMVAAKKTEWIRRNGAEIAATSVH